jgi:hypothetical protein
MQKQCVLVGVCGEQLEQVKQEHIELFFDSMKKYIELFFGSAPRSI